MLDEQRNFIEKSSIQRRHIFSCFGWICVAVLQYLTKVYYFVSQF